MTLLLQIVVSGVVAGFTYGLVGLSASILFKTTGIFSFAQPMIATLLAFFAYFLIGEFKLSFWIALPLLLVIAAAVGAGVYYVAFRPGDGHGQFNLVVRTLGLFLLIEQFVAWRWSRGEPFAFPPLIGGPSVSLGAGIMVARQTIAIAAITVVLLVVCYLLLTRTRTGLMLRCLAESGENSAVLGMPRRRLAATAWAASTVICVFVAVFNAPITNVYTAMFTPFVLFAFAGLLIGGLYSWSGALVGGVIVGIAVNVSAAYWKPEIGALIVFVLLLGVLVFRPAGIVGRTFAERL
ncbi:branched-chain amino acid ABC transporter permease [Pseudonocardia sulfidoxydans NBRC 16205]|uniref:Branched-chain amino acid ABC transporter permease n=1 Tax=Pseudonocardia sulfidoxydans NBRC 16205 TaxID=1223511 RepID=A0A511DR15_9PSEU|nr:branched-chain amino acid ABC transporter permease [Pseudonocardia sulfidoxydans]GEL26767.1 branched-chain amino acid ABC transporter permease [Pseudonocardia sulfidoxydans NBRC 16205]